MVKAFLFILAIVTNEGKLQMRVVEVEACPVKETFSQGMSEMQKRGDFIAWNAACYRIPVVGQDT